MGEIHICRAGFLDYGAAWEWQRALRERRRGGEVPDLLLLVEHPHTYTCGRATRQEHLPGGPEALRRGGAGVFAIERGGSITYHGPGQVVGYPIVDLRERGRDVHRYLRDLERVLVQTLAGFGLRAAGREGLTGVWVGERKVAAIGIHVRHWITLHGFALNVCPDLSFFRRVRPCGLEGEQVGSLEELLGRAPGRGAVEEALGEHFAAIFAGEAVAVQPRALGAPPDSIARSGSKL